MLIEHQQSGDVSEQQKKFFALIGELGAVGSRRIVKQENLLIARIGQLEAFLLYSIVKVFYLF